MNVFETLPYLAKVNLYWILFYACYWLLFRKHTFFEWNRFYLLWTLAISLLLPLVVLPETQPTIVEAARVSESSVAQPDRFEAVSISSEIHLAAVQGNFSGYNLALGIYFAGLAVMVFQFIRGLNNIRRIVSSNTAIHFDEYVLVLVDGKNAAEKQLGSFSFFKWLFLSAEDYEHHLDTILSHELAHIRQRHSYDIIFAELLKAAFWFNPVLWLYKNSLQEVHEFLADEQIPNRNKYSQFLVSYALNAPVQSLTNHFFNSQLLKSRIHMIYKHRTPKWLLSKYLLIAPVATVSLLLMAAREPAAINETMLSKESTPVVHQEPLLKLTAPEESEIRATSRPIVDQSITGRIVDGQGKAIADAIVVVKNSNIGAPTDENGHFELKNVPENSVLVVTHLLYTPGEITLKAGKKDYQQMLQKKGVDSFNEVVVVAYTPVTRGQKTTNSDKYDPVEKKPEFPGGEAEMYRFIGRSVRYPTKALEAEVEGRIILSFRIEASGQTTNVKVIQGLGHGLDEEATRVIYSMPKWIPAFQNGKPIGMEYTLPITYSIESAKSQDKRQGSLSTPATDNPETGLAESTQETKNFSVAENSTTESIRFPTQETKGFSPAASVVNKKQSTTGYYRYNTGSISPQ